MLTHAELAAAARRSYDQCNLTTAWDMEANVEYIHGCVCIAIRGSELDPRDWLRNLAAFPWHFSGLGNVAPYGFGKGAERLVAKFIHELGVTAGGLPIYLTGHSMGAATAILMAEVLHWYRFNVKECVAFAAPRTGTRPLSVPTTIYDHHGDPVCKVPFFWSHPVNPLVLPDMSDGILQHSMDYYLRAMELRDG